MSFQQGLKGPPSNTPQTPQLQPPQAVQRPPSGGLRYPTNRKTIYERNLNRSKTAELSRASFAYLFGEMIGYAQRRVTGIQDLEKRCVVSISVAIGKLVWFNWFNWRRHIGALRE